MSMVVPGVDEVLTLLDLTGFAASSNPMISYQGYLRALGVVS
jgi:hypothetical protein